MSGSLALSSAAFSDAEKTDVRRFCGYPAYGVGATGFMGWRYFSSYGTLEYAMNNLSPAEYQVARQFLAQLYTLEAAIFGAGANLDTDSAAVWKHNKTEVIEREGLFAKWRRALASTLGVPPGPMLNAAGFRVIV